MEDVKNIHISVKATEIAEKIKEQFYFKNLNEVLRFALSLSLRDYLNEIDFDILESQYDSNGANYNTGSIDSDDSVFRTIIPMLIPDCQTPYRFARIAIIYGLYKIDEMMNNDSVFNIASLM